MLKAKKAIMAIGAAISIAKRIAPTVINDAIGWCGLASVSYGFWLLSHAAGFIVAGVLLVASTFLRASRRV